MTRKNILIVFSRYPKPGESKTRLIPAIGPEKAALVQQQMTEDTIAKARELSILLPILVKVFYTGGSVQKMSNWLGPVDLEEQVSGDLGRKMSAAFSQMFEENHGSIVMIGTDCPDLNVGILQEAFVSLGDNDLVIGPAMDGGYYLIGLRREAPFLFTDMPWGSGAVFSETSKRAELHQMKILCLPTLADIDRPEDLLRVAGMRL